MQSLDDKFFYLSLAMVVTALVAASQWDALAIDPRDAAILEPLPVEAGNDPPRQAVGGCDSRRRGRLCAQCVSEPGFPVAARVHLPADERVRAVRASCLVHALVTVAAAAFGYLAVIALRETLVALLGRRWVHRGLAVGAGRADRGAWQRAFS